MHQDVFLDLHPLSNIVNLYLGNIRLVIDNKVAIGKIIDVFPMHVIDLLNALFSIEDFITYFIVPTIFSTNGWCNRRFILKSFLCYRNTLLLCYVRLNLTIDVNYLFGIPFPLKFYVVYLKKFCVNYLYCNDSNRLLLENIEVETRGYLKNCRREEDINILRGGKSGVYG